MVVRRFWNFLMGNAPAPEALAQPQVAPTPAVQSNAPPAPSQVPHSLEHLYPPLDPGIPISSAQDLMQAQEGLVRRTRVHAALPNEQFEARFATPIANVARYVSSLPATPDGLFSGPGGLFRACVETAFGSFQASDGRIFTGSMGVEQRHLLESRWRYVCFLAGLLWPLGRTLESVRVTAPDGKTWPARVGPLETWAQAQGVQKVFCSWPAQFADPGPSSTAATLVPQIVGEGNLQHLEAGSPALCNALILISTGGVDERSRLAHAVVADMWQRVIKMEAARRPQTYGRLQFGHHMAPYLVDAMSQLIQANEWRVNVSTLWVDASGVYLEWPRAALEIGEACRRAGIQGVPNTVDGMLATMEASGLLEVDHAVGPFVEIATEGGAIAAAVKLARPTTVLPDYDPHSYAGRKVLMSAVRAADPLRAAEEAAGIATPAAASKAPGKHSAPASSGTGAPVLAAPPPPLTDLLRSTIGPMAQLPLKGDPRFAAAKAATQAQPSKSESSAPGEPVTASAKDPAASSEANAQPAGKSTKTKTGPAAQGAAAGQAGQRNANTPKQQAISEQTDPPGQKAVRYSDLLPQAVRDNLKPSVAEVLGLLVKEWRDNAPNEHMRTVEAGCAFALEIMIGKVSDVPSFLQALAMAGYLYIAPNAPGRLIYDVYIPEGSDQKRRCFVLARFAAQQMSL